MSNLLSLESSPYLLQHANNPVDWHAWNDAAWEKARRENKLVIVSVGYSACHWCHVMEHESFEDSAVAKVMNDSFICIKVDREERPDVDQIYMDACQIISGRGGWPLNAITLPDGRPIYAGTYFPKEKWIQLLEFFTAYWIDKKEEAFERATQITNGIRSMDIVEQTMEHRIALDQNALFNKISDQWDYEYGGRSGAPKFPMPVVLEYLLHHYAYTKNLKALNALEVTLQKMYSGGIYDHVGGGFARYSVDEYWEIPHFEKMLYDNSQLLSVYSKAFQVTKNEIYRHVVLETFYWLNAELSDAVGAFYSAKDADSEGEEGKFYVWDFHELKSLLGKDFNEFCKIYKVTTTGNFEGSNHLTLNSLNNLPFDKMSKWKQALLAVRNTRIAPLLDDKSITSWNALAITGCVDAYKAFGDFMFLERAIACAEHLKNHILQSDFKLLRNFKNRKATISGFLDDYAFSICAFIDLFEASFDKKWIQLAGNIAEYAIQHFYNIESGLFFYTSLEDIPLIARKTETSDNVIPSSNAALCHGLLKLGYILVNEQYIDIAKRAIRTMQGNTERNPAFYALWAKLNGWLNEEPFQIAIAGKNCLAISRELHRHYLPNCIVVGTEKNSEMPIFSEKFEEDKTLIYICKDKTCGLPLRSAEEVLTLLKS